MINPISTITAAAGTTARTIGHAPTTLTSAPARAAVHTSGQASEGAALIGNGMPADPLWYQKASVYQAHVRSFKDANGDGIGDFQGLTQQLDHIQDLGHDAVWILPFYKSPLRDGGYDIANYYAVNPQYGTMADFENFVGAAHKRGIRVINELVLNHTSDQHAWFVDEVAKLKDLAPAARQQLADKQELRYVWDFATPKSAGPPTTWDETRVIFQDFEPSNWTYNDDAGGWFWHRFYKEQPDLNWDNPEVVKDMTKVVDFWLDKGVDGVRLDAVPYLFERTGKFTDGTPFQGENLRETHDAIKALRSHIDYKYSDRMLLGEANMPAKETLEYFGNGDEAHTLFNFPLMPRLYMGTLFGDKHHVIEGLKLTDDIPEGTAWMTFLRNHDEMTLEKVTPQQRERVWKMFREGDATQGIPANPEAPINLGVRLRLSDLVGHADNPALRDRRMMMMNSMLYSQPGTPIMYYGDEIGMATMPGLADRDGVRTAMQWSDAANGGFSKANPRDVSVSVNTDAKVGASRVNVAAQQADPESILSRTKAMLNARRGEPALQNGKLDIVETTNEGVVAYRRTSGNDQVIAIANLTGTAQTTKVQLAPGQRLEQVHGSDSFPSRPTSANDLELKPYEFQWLKLTTAS